LNFSISFLNHKLILKKYYKRIKNRKKQKMGVGVGAAVI